VQRRATTDTIAMVWTVAKPTSTGCAPAALSAGQLAASPSGPESMSTVPGRAQHARPDRTGQPERENGVDRRVDEAVEQPRDEDQHHDGRDGTCTTSAHSGSAWP